MKDLSSSQVPLGFKGQKELFHSHLNQKSDRNPKNWY